jgi:hypothetical protein
MPKAKDLKKIVRARMEKTGESYTAARLQTLKKKEAPAPDYAALSGVSDSAIEKATGRTWPQWMQLLDAFGAKEKPHRDIARHVFEQGAVTQWWSQTVAVGYERIHGLRAVGQRRAGTWEVSKSRTVAVPLATLFDAVANARKRGKWLTDIRLTVKTTTKEKYIRADVDDGTQVLFGFFAKGESKSSIAVSHVKLPDKETVERMRVFWGEKLNALVETLAG